MAGGSGVWSCECYREGVDGSERASLAREWSWRAAGCGKREAIEKWVRMPRARDLEH